MIPKSPSSDYGSGGLASAMPGRVSPPGIVSPWALTGRSGSFTA
jgi:hypothetical protein